MEYSTNSNNKIAILIPYFGESPKWFDYFILSCSENPDIDWIFFTDCLHSDINSSNTYYFKSTLNDFNELATSKIGININIKHPYKLCELKPAYGLIFSNYIMNYNYWGYGDIDLIYGDILNLIPIEEIFNYDIISNDKEFLTGHFCILKNNDKINQLFRRANNYKEIFQSHSYHGFDEVINKIPVSGRLYFYRITKHLRLDWQLISEFLYNQIRKTWIYKKYKFKKNNLKYQSKERQMKDFTSIVFNLSLNGDIKTRYETTYNCDLMFKKEKQKNWMIKWDNGVLINGKTNKELVYFHFLLSKVKKGFAIEKPGALCRKFSISTGGIKYRDHC